MDKITFKELTEVFRQVFADPYLEISSDTISDDIPGWDSFSHINLMVSIEHHFHIKFSNKEMASFKNVGELVSNIEEKKNAFS